MSKPEFPRPSEGDGLILEEFRHLGSGAGRVYRAEARTVIVHRVARFKVTVRPMDWDGNEYRLMEYDLRTQRGWTGSRDPDVGSRWRGTLYTPETWAYHRREVAANTYLTASGIHGVSFSLKGSLRDAASKDVIGFANVLRRFEGLEEI